MTFFIIPPQIFNLDFIFNPQTGTNNLSAKLARLLLGKMHSLRCFFCKALALVSLCDMIANLRQNRTAYVLHGQTTVANHLARRFQANRPQAEAKHAVALDVFVEPVFYAGLVKGVRVMLHDVGISKHSIQRVKIL